MNDSSKFFLSELDPNNPAIFISNFVAETGSPNSTDKIRQNIQAALTKAVEVSEIPLIHADCDPYSSLGFSHCAVPGSDIEGLLFLTSSKISYSNWNIFKNTACEHINPKMITLFNDGFEIENVIPFNNTLPYLNQTWAEATGGLDEKLFWLLSKDRWAVATCQIARRLKHRPPLYLQPNSSLISQIMVSNLAATSPTYEQFSIAEEPTNSGFPNKYHARLLLHTLWPKLNDNQRLKIILTSLIYCGQRSPNHSDYTDENQNTEILDQLVNYGLFYKTNELYQPSWLTPLPHIFSK